MSSKTKKVLFYCLGPTTTPTNKYSPAPSPFTDSILDTKNMSEDTVKLINASLTASSWRKHAAALNCFKKFENHEGTKFPWPLTENNACKFIAWAIYKQHLKASTVKSYMASLVFVHKVKNMDSSGLTSFITNTALKGAVNLEFYVQMTKNSRKVMTIPLLKILGHQVAKSSHSSFDKQVLWTAFSIAFFGSFRFAELLPQSSKLFNPNETLLWRNIIFGQDSVSICVKIPKNRNPKGEIIDLFEVTEGNICPVTILKNLYSKAKGRENPDMPVFQFENKTFLSCSTINAYLDKFLRPVIGDEAKHITGHSFRAALASALANCPDIANEADVKLWGRWNSSAYKLYTRLTPRKKRIIFQKILVSLKLL
jgi:hypothetical protein